ncbi:hypothetical protein H5410_026881 [Solanum commersonii]|uniref:Uncharacterized protein n=1 Tax=Solanum commersonii TaxID=4109 RepID=A0A9J5YZS0_SOLCO|nr:hypothetical protein H5410_026881 [Solanum commersonii]
MVALQAASRAIQSGSIGIIKKKLEDVPAVTYKHGEPSHKYPNNPQLLDILHTSHTRKLPDLIPRNFDGNKRCAYHSGIQGHDTEDCYGLKNQIESLIRRGVIKCTPAPPNVNNNPLTNHENWEGNMVTLDEEYWALTVQT